MLISTYLVQSKQNFNKGITLIKKDDSELSELLGVSYVSVTRWRIGQR